MRKGLIASGDGQGNGDRKLDPEQLLDAALSLVAEEGLGGLTLRPLARKLGYSVATLGRQLGSKDALLDHLIALAAKADEADLTPWLRLVESFPSLPRDSLIDITEEVLRMRSGSGRLRSYFKCELLQAASSNRRLRPALLQWIAGDQRFWHALAQRSEEAPGFDMADALEAFALDDAAHALIANDHDGYRWIRREGVRRLWYGLFAGPTSSNVLYDRAISDTPSPNHVPLWTVRELTSERDRTFGSIIADIILDGGTDAVTHREVARRADTPHTSIAYHYPLQDDLVELGMNAIVDMVRRGSQAAMSGRELPVEARQFAFASLAISLAAARRPSLQPIAREMRRRRGENLLLWLRRNAPQDVRIDMADTQAMSTVLIGAFLLARAGGRSSVPLTRQLFALAGDWPRLLARFQE